MTAALSPTSPRSRFRISPVKRRSAAGSKRRNLRTSSPVRIGCGTFGPFLSNSTLTPIAWTGTRMSEKKMTPSGAKRRNGCRDTSAARSGSRQRSMKETRRRTSRYSGRYRPAWRIIHAGARSTGRPKQASRNRWAEGELVVTGPMITSRPRTAPVGSGDQVPQDVRQDPAVPVIVDFDRGVDPRAQRHFIDRAVRPPDGERQLAARMEPGLDPRQIEHLGAVEAQRARADAF